MTGQARAKAQDTGEGEARGAVANQWILNILQPLRDVLPSWPAVLPSRVGDPIRPLKIGVHEDMKALLQDPSSDALEILGRAIRRYTLSHEYRGAILAPESWRHGLDGTPVEPVSEEHKAAPPRPRKEFYVVSVQVKALKVTVTLDPLALTPAPQGAPIIISVSTPNGLRAHAAVSPKSYRKAVEAIRQHGPENVTVTLQGRMVKAGEIIDGALAVKKHEAPAAAPAPAPAVPPRPGQLTLKAGRGAGG
jgi:hypothetical protein